MELGGGDLQLHLFLVLRPVFLAVLLAVLSAAIALALAGDGRRSGQHGRLAELEDLLVLLVGVLGRVVLLLVGSLLRLRHRLLLEPLLVAGVREEQQQPQEGGDGRAATGRGAGSFRCMSRPFCARAASLRAVCVPPLFSPARVSN